MLALLLLPLAATSYRLTTPHPELSAQEILNKWSQDFRGRSLPPEWNRRTPPPVDEAHRGRSPAVDILGRTPSPLENRHSFPPEIDNRGRTPPPELNRRSPPPVDGANRGRTQEPEFSEFVGVTVNGEQLNLLTFRGHTPGPVPARYSPSLGEDWSRTAESDVQLNRRSPPPAWHLPSWDEFFPFHGRTADPQLWNGHSRPVPTGAAAFHPTPSDIQRRSFPPRHRTNPPADELGPTPVPELNRHTMAAEDIRRRTHVPPFHKTPPVDVNPVMMSTPGSV